jgi:pyruvate dehydrogenase E1 component alpha subunit
MTSTNEARNSPSETDLPVLLAMLRSMMLIRAFEDRLMRLPRPGFQLLSAGEEAVAVGVCAALNPNDQLLSSGRSIGPALARGLEPATVMAELLGKASGPCQGKGGRGHIAQPSSGFFGAHSVVGGNLSVAAGIALAAQMQHSDAIVAVVFGDGACGAGALHETLNLAALWKLPLLLICNNNGYSISTPVEQALAPRRLADLAQPFGLPARTVDGMDAVAILQAVRPFAERARAGEGASFLECLSCRFNPHSTATRESRSEEELRQDRARCPINTLAARLLAAKRIDDAALRQLQQAVEEEVAGAARSAEDAPYLDLAKGLEDDT